jgi:hypothetical protein
MKHIKISNMMGLPVLILFMVLGFSYIVVLPIHGHGGKTHGDEAVTALQAVQKATELYDRLVVSGKLPEVWETRLKAIKISTRNTGNKREYIVQFEAAKDDPSSVYFFFNQEGEYIGSNFTGK